MKLLRETGNLQSLEPEGVGIVFVEVAEVEEEIVSSEADPMLSSREEKGAGSNEMKEIEKIEETEIEEEAEVEADSIW